MLDVGTGAGFPGMPLAILCPETEFVLLDALRKRIDFLNEVIETLGLTNVTAVHARAEDFAKDSRASFHVQWQTCARSASWRCRWSRSAAASSP